MTTAASMATRTAACLRSLVMRPTGGRIANIGRPTALLTSRQISLSRTLCRGSRNQGLPHQAPARLGISQGHPQRGRCPVCAAPLRHYATETRTGWDSHRLTETEVDNGKIGKGTKGTNTERESPSGASSRDNSSGSRLTLFAGVGLFSAMVVMLQPLSISIGSEQCENVSDSTAAGDHEIGTPAPMTGDDRDPSLPRYRLADIRKHDAGSDMPWVTSGDKVYDITDWVAAHPGGPVILQAAGGSIDPYWNIFTIHKAPHVYEILSQYLIGLVDAADLVDGKPAAEGVEDPFASDPVRDGRFLTHTAKPCNAEPPRTEVSRDFTTANELFYVRNHMWVPVVDGDAAGQHRLSVELPDGEVRTYTLDELQQRFPRHQVTAVLQCSGNRRSDMTQSVGKTNGLQWGVGAISNAVWEGVLLRDVLADAGLRVASTGLPMRRQRSSSSDSGYESAGSGNGNGNNNDDADDDLPLADQLHVQLAGMEAYAASIPLPTALDPRGDVLLAFSMNGEPLPRDHGFPLRAVVPGHVAARSVKWLSHIVVAEEESTSQWQRRDYKLFGPNEGGKPNWDRYPAIQEMPVTSAITGVWVGSECIRRSGQKWWLSREAEERGGGEGDGKRAAAGLRGDPQAWQKEHLLRGQAGGQAEPVAVTGYAYSGGGREIVRVDVSLDGGRTWDQAELLDQRDEGSGSGSRDIVAKGTRDWAWKRWRYAGRLLQQGDREEDSNSGCAEIVVKATDCAYNTQPERHDGIYNVRGNLATAWHRVRVCPAVSVGDDGRRTAKWTTDKSDVRGCGFE